MCGKRAAEQRASLDKAAAGDHSIAGIVPAKARIRTRPTDRRT